MGSNGPTTSTSARFGAPPAASPRFANSVAGDDYATSVQKANYYSGVQSQNVDALTDRRAATSQVLDLGYEAYTSFDEARQHQGAIGSFVESVANGFGVKGSANNVDQRIRDDQQVGYDLVNSIGSSDVVGSTFSQDYNKNTGFDYDPNRPVVTSDDNRLKDGKFGGAVGDSYQAVEDYKTSQKRGMTGFNIGVGILAGVAAFPVGGLAGLAVGAGLAMGTTLGTTALEDNTRGDGTHDFGVGDYFKQAGISAAGSVVGAGASMAVGSVLSGIGKGASGAINTGVTDAAQAAETAAASGIGKGASGAVNTGVTDAAQAAETAAASEVGQVTSAASTGAIDAVEAASPGLLSQGAAGVSGGVGSFGTTSSINAIARQPVTDNTAFQALVNWLKTNIFHHHTAPA